MSTPPMLEQMVLCDFLREGYYARYLRAMRQVYRQRRDRLHDALRAHLGDLHLGGEYRFRFFASGSEGVGHVEACEPSRRLLLVIKDNDATNDETIEVTLAADGDQTVLVVEERGMPVDQLAAYGAGIQIHVEDLAAYLAGRARGNAEARWNELVPPYQNLADNVG
jgi:hypothetical protein